MPEPVAERVDADLLRGLPIEAAEQQRVLCHGDVATRLGFRFHQGFVASLTAALRRVPERNRSSSEPGLMCLVVSKSNGMPGRGFFEMMRRTGSAADGDQQVFEAQRQRCWEHRWS